MWMILATIGGVFFRRYGNISQSVALMLVTYARKAIFITQSEERMRVILKSKIYVRCIEAFRWCSAGQKAVCVLACPMRRAPLPFLLWYGDWIFLLRAKQPQDDFGFFYIREIRVYVEKRRQRNNGGFLKNKEKNGANNQLLAGVRGKGNLPQQKQKVYAQHCVVAYLQKRQYTNFCQ